MTRLNLYRMRQTRLPEVIGKCQSDVPDIAAACNSAQLRLLRAPESADEGWWGTYAAAVFNVQQSNPYIPCVRDIARIEVIDVCRRPVQIQNQFYEFLQFGNGYQRQFQCGGRFTHCGGMEGYDRGGFPTFIDLTPGHIVRVMAVNPLDTAGNKRVLISGTDASDQQVYTLDNANNVQGVFVVLVPPFADTPMTFNGLTGITKDVTLGQVQFFDVDPISGAQTLILTMEPGETTAWYRRYFINKLPRECCVTGVTPSGNPLVQIEAIVKLEAVPVTVDTDYLLLQNEEAIIAEAQSMRYSTMDLPSAKAMAAAAHKEAIGYLQGELAHYLGTDKPAISFHPFGSATLERQRIGTLI